MNRTTLPALHTRFGHLISLATVAVGLPLFDLLERQPQFWVAHRVTGWQVLGITCLLILLVPLPFMVIEAALSRAPARACLWVHHGAMAIFASLFALLLLHRLPPLAGTLTSTLALAAGATATWAYQRNVTLQRFVALMGGAAIALLVLLGARGAIEDLRAAATADFDRLPALDTHTPVIVVLFDGLALAPLLDARGELDRERFPGFATFADHAIWFRHTATAAGETQYAIPAILTGRLPRKDAVMDLASHPNNLFTLFARSHRIWAFEPISELCPRFLDREEETKTAGERWAALRSDLAVVYAHLVLPRAWADRLPPVDNAWEGFASAGSSPRSEGFFTRAIRQTRSDRRLDLERFLASLRQARGPTLHVLHTLLPHRPWNLLPTGHRYRVPKHTPELERGRVRDDPYAVHHARRRATLQIAFLDRFVSRLVETLRAADRFEESLIVLAADHGGAIEAGRNPRELGPGTTPQLVPIPLLIKPPRDAGPMRVDRATSSLDIVPIVLDLLDVDPPWPLDGRSTLAAAGRTSLPFLDIDERWHELPVSLFDGLVPAAARLAATRGDPAEPFSLFRSGPYGDLVGSPLEELEQAGASAWRGALERPAAFAHVDLAGPSLPALLQGHLRPTGDAPNGAFAIALNEIIAATAPFPTEAAPGSTWRPFYALLAPQLFVGGTNRVELFEIRRPRKHTRLRPIALLAPEG